MNREFLMLAKTFNPDKHRIANWFLSTKYDGVRCLWDGGVTTGVPKHQVPWANNRKDERYKEPPVATGLWSRYGNVIHAPNYFIKSLPEGLCLDGELYLGPQKFQKTISIISKLVPVNEEWKSIKFLIIDMPNPRALFTSGKINNLNFIKFIHESECMCLFPSHVHNHTPLFVEHYEKFIDIPVPHIKQFRLPKKEEDARKELYNELDRITSIGGEGLILRNPRSMYRPYRVPDMLKLKKMDYDVGTIVGFEFGVGKYKGMMGSIKVRTNEGKEFNLSGFTDEERRLDQGGSMAHFSLGDTIKYKYSGFTKDGLPREARYAR